jgi:hypothetical protein
MIRDFQLRSQSLWTGLIVHKSDPEICKTNPKTGNTFDLIMFDNYFDLVQLNKNRSFSLLEHNINRT